MKEKAKTILKSQYIPTTEFYSQVIDSLQDYAIFTLSNDLKINSWSSGAKKLFQYENEDIIGKHFDIIFTEEDKKNGTPKDEIKKASKDGRALDNRWHKCKDGSTFWASGLVFPLIGVDGEMLGYVKILRNLTDTKKLEESGKECAKEIEELKINKTSILQKNVQLRNLTAHLEQIREEERTIVSREIHDELGQQLTALKMDIDWVLHKQNNTEERIVSKLNKMLKQSEELINAIRRISYDLRPGIIDDLGLIAALEWKCNDFEEKAGIQCKFISKIKERKFENLFSINVYRILQESLTNIIRHSEAKSVSVSVSENETELLLEITDDGKGIDSENLSNKKNLGIIGMNERAALLGGELIIEGTPNKGTKIKLILPFKNEYTNS